MGPNTIELALKRRGDDDTNKHRGEDGHLQTKVRGLATTLFMDFQPPEL
jgi:hypothetical protein